MVEFRERVLSCQPAVLDLACRIAGEVKKLPAQPRYAPNLPQAFICGGFVRDALLGVEPNDLDMQVFGVSQPDLIEIMQRLFPEKCTVFRAIKVEFGKDFVIENYEIDVGIVLRLSTKSERLFEDGDPSITPAGAAALSDFTCNSMLADPLSGEVTDLPGGIEDLRQGRLVLCSPKHALYYPFLVYRGVQIASRYSLTPDQKTLEIFTQLVAGGELDEFQESARTREEISKLLLKSPRPSHGIKLLRQVGVFKRHFPELDDIVQRTSESWDSTLEGLDAVATAVRATSEMRTTDKLVLLLAALTFDLSEVKTKRLLEKLAYRKELCLRVLLCRYYQPRLLSLAAELVRIESEVQKKGSQARTSRPVAAPVPSTSKHAHRMPALGRLSLGRSVPTIAKVEEVSPYQSTHQALRDLLRLAQPVDWRVVLAFTQALPDQTLSLEEKNYRFSLLTQHISQHSLYESANNLLTTEDLLSKLKLEPGFHIGIIKGEVNRRRFELLFPERALIWVQENIEELMQIAKERENSLDSTCSSESVTAKV